MNTALIIVLGVVILYLCDLSIKLSLLHALLREYTVEHIILNSNNIWLDNVQCSVDHKFIDTR